MSRILQIFYIVILIGIVHSWIFSSDHSGNTNSTSMSIFPDMNRIMAMMHQRLFGFSSDRTQLDAITPNCTTITNTPSTSIRRKKFRQTQTTTCTKELILNGQKHFYKEINITNTQGILISQSKIYQTISITNDTMSANPNVISY